MLNNEYAILFVRGERPIIDYKYNILKHPRVKFTNDGKGKAYIHGKTNNANASIVVDYNIENYKFSNVEQTTEDYEIIFCEDIEEFLRKKEDKNEEKI